MDTSSDLYCVCHNGKVVSRCQTAEAAVRMMRDIVLKPDFRYASGVFSGTPVCSIVLLCDYESNLMEVKTNDK